MSDINRRLSLAMAAAAAVLHVWAPSAGADPEGTGRETTTHILVGLTPTSSFSVSVENEELPSGPVITDDLGIATFTVDDGAFPSGPLTVRVHPTGELVITGIVVTEVTQTSAVVQWTTNLPSNSLVQYGETPAYGSESPLDPTPTLEHEVELSGLSSGTAYHFRAVSDDGEGHTAESADHQFATLADSLVITGVHVEDVGPTWAIAVWTTNRPADSRVEYGPTPAYGSSTPVDPILTTDHVVVLDGLEASTSYHFRALSSDGQGSDAQSSDHSFETDPEPLVVLDVGILDVGATWAVVAWTTNRESDSQVEYGETVDYGLETPVEPAMVIDHVVTITGLSPGTLYHFRARSEDAADGVAHSEDRAFVTDVVPLTISGLTVADVGVTWAVIEWVTDRPASTLVAYGPTSAYGALEDSDQGFVTEHSATLSGLAEGALYHFRAISIDEDHVIGSSGDSTFVTMGGEPTGPPVVTNVAALERSATSVIVTWTTDRPASSQVRYGTRGVFDCATEADTTLVVDHHVLVAPVVPVIEYSFVVVSACGGDTATSDPRTFVTTRPPGGGLSEYLITIGRPGIPVLGDTSATIRWATDRACSTWVEWGRDESYGSAVAGRVLDDLLYEATLDHLLAETVYHYRVCALSERGNPVFGGDRTFETLASDVEPPAAPTGLLGRLLGESIELVWAANPELDLLGYYVYRARAGAEEGGWSRAVRLNEIPIKESRYVDSLAEHGSMYSYVVTAVDLSWNESAPSGSVVLDVPEGLGEPVRLAAFPNPTRAGVSFAFSVPPSEPSVRLRIVSPGGRVVHEVRRDHAEAGEHALVWEGTDSSGTVVGSGVYLCELVIGGTIARQKLTVLR